MSKISTLSGAPATVSLETYVPNLSDASNIQTALQTFYFGTTSNYDSNDSIYAHLLSFKAHGDSATGVHNVSGSVVGTDSIQTLTNKTLTSPAISSPTISGTLAGSFTTSGTITNSGTISGGTVNATTYQQSGTSGFLIPAGVIVPYSASAAPTGWLMCNGATLNANTSPQYQTLWSVIGITYGGSSSASFLLPDLRGRAVIGYGQGSGLTNRAFATTGGAETVAVPVPYHRHYTTLTRRTTTADTHDHEGWSAGDFAAPVDDRSGETETTQSNNYYTDYQGTNGVTMSVVQPYIPLNYIIKY